ncbi:hydroxymyristoyl-ACP dehydratase [Chitinophaga silvatica]|uniref:Hydroxymyristoyl-ACP dehydratase n=1 Tax=Chitinophaga silvatica TaxID=2282649 RepID=A0A3E1YGM5_9BACT|nr:3-hydroxyacyl-ACP dehydratase FabZ family protein [Chitinophaga silvatica]RFS26539.1 hydroxymyristoyl-ACP dehydratase [Chitinophaga silvatica]
MTKEEVLSYLPYSKPFLFVDTLEYIDENSVKGSYTFDKDLVFYNGHFINNPVTPGVILTETMAQIGLACLGIYLLKDTIQQQQPGIALTSSEVSYYLPVYPGEVVNVVANKVYFRFGKLKCQVALWNEAGQLVCDGTLAGMIITDKK